MVDHFFYRTGSALAGVAILTLVVWILTNGGPAFENPVRVFLLLAGLTMLSIVAIGFLCDAVKGPDRS